MTLEKGVPKDADLHAYMYCTCNIHTYKFKCYYITFTAPSKKGS